MIPEISLRGSWEDLFKQSNEEHLELVLPGYFRHCRWMDGDPRTIAAVELHDAFRLRYGDPAGNSVAFICLVEIHFDDGTEDEFVVPLTRAPIEKLESLHEHGAGAVIARLRGDGDGILCDAIEDPAFREAIVRAIAARRVFPTRDGELVASSYQGFDLPPAESSAAEALPSRVSREEQANTSILYGDRMVLKVFRRIEEGTHPEVEVGRALAKAADSRVAPLLGAIEFRRRNRPPVTLAVLHGFMPHEGTAWQYTLDEISRTIDRVLSLPIAEQQPPAAAGKLVDIAREETPPAVREFLGQFLESAQILGARTADVHLALARETDDPAFAPEPFTRLYQRSIYQSMRNVHRQG
jgi:maltose alpha-D-glucosyltransferase/alpha-amylase